MATKLGELAETIPNTAVTVKGQLALKLSELTSKGQVEAPLAAEEVTTKTPEYGTGEEADVLCECKKRRSGDIEFEGDGRY